MVEYLAKRAVTDAVTSLSMLPDGFESRPWPLVRFASTVAVPSVVKTLMSTPTSGRPLK